MIFNLLEYPEEADDQVCAISHESHADKTNQGKLAIAYSVPDSLFERRHNARGSREFIVP